MTVPNFCRYGGQGYVTAEDLIAEASDSQMLTARAEESGCEGCYCEVARWNESGRQWQRYAFCKLFGGELPEVAEGPHYCVRTAQAIANQINAVCYLANLAPVIHAMPDYVAA